jgi:hypothetical protein
MPRWQKIDEFRIELFVPANRTPRGIQAALADPALLNRLRAAVRRLLAETPAVKTVRIKISR